MFFRKFKIHEYLHETSKKISLKRISWILGQEYPKVNMSFQSEYTAINHQKPLLLYDIHILGTGPGKFKLNSFNISMQRTKQKYNEKGNGKCKRDKIPTGMKNVSSMPSMGLQ